MIATHMSTVGVTVFAVVIALCVVLAGFVIRFAGRVGRRTKDQQRRDGGTPRSTESSEPNGGKS